MKITRQACVAFEVFQHFFNECHLIRTEVSASSCTPDIIPCLLLDKTELNKCNYSTLQYKATVDEI